MFCPNCESQLEGAEKKKVFKCPKCGKDYLYVNGELREIKVIPIRPRKPFFKDSEDFVKKNYGYGYPED